jgi:hypothetical protein
MNDDGEIDRRRYLKGERWEEMVVGKRKRQAMNVRLVEDKTRVDSR